MGKKLVLTISEEGTPPEMEANAEEALYLKEAEAEAFMMWKLEASALPPMRLLASLIFC